MRALHTSKTLAAVLGAGIFAFGCGSDDGSATGAAGGSTSKDSGSQTQTTKDSTGDVSTKSPAADLRVTLDRLLAEHATLAAVATQKGLKGAPDFAAAGAALDANAVELSEAIGSVYGEEAGKQFLDGPQLWRAHIGFFVDYTVALAKKDAKGQKTAVAKLGGYQKAFSGFLSGATGLPQADLEAGVGEHIGHLKGQIDAYAAGQYDKAYDLERTGYSHMVMTGDALAGAIVNQMPDQFDTGSATQSATDLRVTLGTLLGEHALLAQFATQKGLKGEADFAAIGKALDANSVALSEAIGSVYGEEAGKQFLDGPQLWRDHIGFFVDYTVALAKKDAKGQKAAVAKLGGYQKAFSGFLAEATGLPQADLEAAVSEHVVHLKTQIDDYSKGDYKKSYTTLRHAYAHMYGTGDVLAEAIVAQNPDKFQN